MCLISGVVFLFVVWHVGSVNFHPSVVSPMRCMFSQNVSFSRLGFRGVLIFYFLSLQFLFGVLKFRIVFFPECIFLLLVFFGSILFLVVFLFYFVGSVCVNVVSRFVGFAVRIVFHMCYISILLVQGCTRSCLCICFLECLASLFLVLLCYLFSGWFGLGFCLRFCCGSGTLCVFGIFSVLEICWKFSCWHVLSSSFSFSILFCMLACLLYGCLVFVFHQIRIRRLRMCSCVLFLVCDIVLVVFFVFLFISVAFFFVLH